MSHVNLFQARFDRAALAPDEDVAVFTGACRPFDAAVPDDIRDMDNAARDAFATRLSAFISGIADLLTTQIRLVEARFYDIPTTPGPLGEAAHIAVLNTPGNSSSTPLPPQMASTVTWRTDKRRQWGRIYVPGITMAHVDAKGRLDSVAATEIGNSAHGLTSRSGNGTCLTVWSRVQWTHHDPQEIVVDDVLDVVRSRRFSRPIFQFGRAAG